MNSQTGSVRKFAIIAAQRTGSTLLVRSLDLSPRIFCAGEIFHSGPRVHHSEFSFQRQIAGSLLLGKFVDAAIGHYRIRTHLRQLFETAGNGVEAVGIKVMASQLRQRRPILPTLIELGVTLLFLYRNDSFATALSYCKAKATGIYHSDRMIEAHPRHALTIPTTDFARQLANCKLEKNSILKLHAEHGGTLLIYEDMLNNWPHFVESVARALNLPRLELRPALEKLDASTSRFQIANEAELRNKFEGQLGLE